MAEKKSISFSLPQAEYDHWKRYIDSRMPRKPLTIVLREAMAEKIQRETQLIGWETVAQAIHKQAEPQNSTQLKEL